MLDLFEKALAMQKDKIPFVINIIIKKEGSSPRECGAWMIVDNCGLQGGTIGGGALEYNAIKKSKELLNKKISQVESYSLNDEEAKNMGMVCGGKNTVLFLYVDPEDFGLKNIMESIILNHENSKVEVAFSTNPIGTSLYIDGVLQKPIEKDENSLLEYKKFLITGRKRIFIFGGGHIAQNLVPILYELGFETVVIEDRVDFLEIEPFYNSKRILTLDYDVENLGITIHDYICILTRGHKFDRKVLFNVLDKKPRYIGIIGSKRKAKLFFDELETSPYKNMKAVIHMPIGIDIKGETPFEIAISIASEIILNYRNYDESN